MAYHAYDGIAEEGEFYVKSTDSGKTWSTIPTPVNSADQLACTPNVVAKPGDTACLSDQDYNTFSGPMLVDQNTGELYVVYGISDTATNATSTGGFGNPRGLVVAHSADGTTWTNKYAVVINGMVIDGEYVASGFPWGLVDAAGNVYVVFTPAPAVTTTRTTRTRRTTRRRGARRSSWTTTRSPRARRSSRPAPRSPRAS